MLTPAELAEYKELARYIDGLDPDHDIPDLPRLHRFALGLSPRVTVEQAQRVNAELAREGVHGWEPQGG